MREPHCEDVAELLLFCAPKDLLTDIPLTEQNKDAFIDEFHSTRNYVFGNYHKDDIAAWAIYYATKYKGEYSVNVERILKEIAISFNAIKDLIIFVEFEERLKFGDDKVNKAYKTLHSYTAGPRNKSIEAKNKWAKAKEYFLEEKPKHKTLKLARKAAAERAGIFVEERRLAEMLRNPK